MPILRVNSDRVDSTALEGNVPDKLFGGCIDDAYRSLLSGAQLGCSLRCVREVVVVGGRIVPDFICVADLRDWLASFPRSRIQGQATDTATHRHETPLRTNRQAAERQIEYTALAHF